MNTASLRLRELDKTNETQQFIHTVLFNSQLNVDYLVDEKMVNDKIEENLQLANDHHMYDREVGLLVHWYERKKYILHDNKFYSMMDVDFWVSGYLIEVKCKSEIEVSDKIQLGRLLTYKGGLGLILAHYTDKGGKLLSVNIVQSCQLGVYFDKSTSHKQC